MWRRRRVKFLAALAAMVVLSTMAVWILRMEFIEGGPREMVPAQALEEVEGRSGGPGFPSAFAPISALSGGVGNLGEAYIAIAMRAFSSDLTEYLTVSHASEGYRFKFECQNQPDRLKYAVHQPYFGENGPLWKQSFSKCDEIVQWTVPLPNRASSVLAIYRKRVDIDEPSSGYEKFMLEYLE